MQKQNPINNNFIIKPFENAFAVWFKQSKSFLLLVQPAYEVFVQYINGGNKNEIIEICQQKYGQLENNIPQFVDEIIEHIHYYNNPENTVDLSKKALLSDTIQSKSFLPSVFYQFGKVIIVVKYENEFLKSANHPVIAHLETKKPTEISHIIECFENKDLLVLKYNGKLIEAFSPNKIEYYTGATKQLMYSIIYQRKFNDWMTMLHASGVTSNNKAILFSAAAGSGKSTISAWLKALGYGYLSDDFIATDETGKAYPFPAAISVKKGSEDILSEYYPELKNQKTRQSFIGKTVKYIPVYNFNQNSFKGTPVKAFVFVNYSNKEEFVFERVNKKKALQLLLKETWVNPLPKYVSGFFDWIDKTDFYQLQYSETNQALTVVQKIFDE